MTAQEMVHKDANRPVSREETRSTGRIMVPAVDIYENDDNLTLVADMPGVSKEGLDINLEKGALTIKGESAVQERGNFLLREHAAARYYRQFRLTEQIDAEKTSAELKNGVLTLMIPKAESAKPKKIEIRQA